MPIVWRNPDATIGQYTFTEAFLARERKPGEATGDAVLRLFQTHVCPKLETHYPGISLATPVLVRTADVPSDRSRRHAWRLNGKKIEVDATVPNPPHPKQSLLDAIAAATDLTSLKAALRAILGGE